MRRRELPAAMISPVHVDLPLQPVLELLGVFVGALSGGLAAVRKGFDIFGIVVLAWVAGLGGGILRDVLIGAIPPVGIARWQFVATACAAGLLTWAAHPALHRLRRLVLVLDAGALALFTVVGTVKALEYGVGATAAVFAGIVTGVGGGVLRDLLTGELPAVLHQRQLYAIPSLLGALVLAVLWREDALSEGTVVAVVVGVLGVRLIALRFGWRAPGPWDREAARARLGRVGGVGRAGRAPREQPAPLLRWVARLRRSRAAGREDGGAGRPGGS